ncbi:hypothetical protein Syun_022935 [Stephania yunnanensis]|uniref:Uncharacterized protein n=1 Tax=Stephania yunnanensis TaxID=152371 RepID=A0AAP0F8M6_9MAGN
MTKKFLEASGMDQSETDQHCADMNPLIEKCVGKIKEQMKSIAVFGKLVETYNGMKSLARSIVPGSKETISLLVEENNEAKVVIDYLKKELGDVKAKLVFNQVSLPMLMQP